MTVFQNSSGTGLVVDTATFVCDYNTYYAYTTTSPFYWGTQYLSFTQWKATTGQDAHSAVGAVSFTNPSGNDYTLQGTDTVAKDKGTDLTSVGVTVDKNGVSRPQPAGGAFDIGCYEYDGANDSGNSITDFTVQNGMLERSFVRYVAVTFATATGVQDLITYNRIQLTQYALDGSGGTPVSLAGVMSASGNQITLDFGTLGLGGNPNSTVGDGYYDLALDMDADGVFETHRHFYRLLGDVDGDRVVTVTDANLILAAYGHSGPNVNEDVNGDGVVNAADRTLTIRSLGRQLAGRLRIDD